MDKKETIAVSPDVWASVLIALEQCLAHMAGDQTERAAEVREYGQRALRAARPARPTH